MNASANYCQDEEEYVVGASLPASCLAFFNSKSVDTANQELAEQFREMGIPEAYYATGTAQALRTTKGPTSWRA